MHTLVVSVAELDMLQLPDSSYCERVVLCTS